MARRLRIPTELAVSLVGTSATLAFAISACQESRTPEPIDSTTISGMHHDAGIDGRIRDALPADASEPSDAPPPPIDAHPPDTPPT